MDSKRSSNNIPTVSPERLQRWMNRIMKDFPTEEKFNRQQEKAREIENLRMDYQARLIAVRTMLMQTGYSVLANQVYAFFSPVESFFSGVNDAICHIDPLDHQWHPEIGIFIWSKDNVSNLKRLFEGTHLPPLFDEQLLSLSVMLSQCLIERQLNPYVNFKLRIGDSVSIFDFPQCFILYDGNLFLKYDDEWEREFIHERNYISLLNKLPNQPKPTKKEFRFMAEYLKCSAATEGVKRLLNTPTLLMSDIVFRLQNNGYEPIVEMMNDNTQAASFPKRRVSRIKYAEPEGYSYIDNLDAFLEVYKQSGMGIVEEAWNILFDITGGDIKVIDQLSMVIASMSFSGNKPASLWALTGDTAAMKLFLHKLYEYEFIIMPVSPRNLKKASEIAIFIQAGYNGSLMTFLLPCSTMTQLDTAYFSTLNKMIKGVAVKINDRAYGKMTYVNRSTMLVDVRNDRELEQYSRGVGKKLQIIDIKRGKTTLPLKPIGVGLRAWFGVVFATYGLGLLLCGQKGVQRKYDSGKIVREFIDTYCVVDENVTCYNQDLYDAYKEYFSTRFSVQAMKRGEFLRTVDVFCSVTPKRPRTKKTDNRRGLKGIAVDEVKREAYLVNCTKVGVERILVKEYVYQMNKKVMQLLEGE